MGSREQLDNGLESDTSFSSVEVKDFNEESNKWTLQRSRTRKTVGAKSKVLDKNHFRASTYLQEKVERQTLANIEGKKGGKRRRRNRLNASQRLVSNADNTSGGRRSNRRKSIFGSIQGPKTASHFRVGFTFSHTSGDTHDRSSTSNSSSLTFTSVKYFSVLVLPLHLNIDGNLLAALMSMYSRLDRGSIVAQDLHPSSALSSVPLLLHMMLELGAALMLC